MNNANYFDYDADQWHDDLAEEDRRERFWAAGAWKPLLIGAMGVVLLLATFGTPQRDAVYLNWLIGFVAGNAAIAMSGNRKWERPLAGAAAIWLFMSGFVRSLYESDAWMRSDVIVAVLLIVAAASAAFRLRQDIREQRPHAL